MTLSSAEGNVKRRFLPMPSHAVHFCTLMVDKELFERRKKVLLSVSSKLNFVVFSKNYLVSCSVS